MWAKCFSFFGMKAKGVEGERKKRSKADLLESVWGLGKIFCDGVPEPCLQLDVIGNFDFILRLILG